MKWIGQHIWDFISRFRSDVYLEDLSTTTESNVLVVDSDGKVSKNTTTLGGDLTAIVAGTNLSGTDLSGPIPTINLDNPLAGPVEIEQGASGGGSALTIDNDDTDQIALDIDAANTSATVIDIVNPGVNGSSNKIINIDIDDAGVTGVTRSLIAIDYDKSGITATGQSTRITGLKVDLNDSVENVGTVIMTGLDIDIDYSDLVGTAGITTGIGAVIDVTDADTNTGIELTVEDGGTDIKCMSSAGAGDYFSIATTASGATTLTTVDGGSYAADLTLDVDGDITFDAYGKQFNFDWNGTNMVLFDVNANNYKFMHSSDQADYFNINVGVSGATTLTTVDDGAAVAHFEIAADGDITLDSAGQIKLEPVAGNNILLDGTIAVDAGVVTGATSITSTEIIAASRKYELPSSTVGDYKGGDIYYYGDGSTVAGGIYYIDGTNWTLADADAEASTSGLLAVALGTDPDVDGMLLRGFVTLKIEIEGTEAIGSPIYLSATDSGVATITVPGSGDFVRVLGYSLHATDNQVYFNPDNTWVEVA